jgi:hypothetical protein
MTNFQHPMPNGLAPGALLNIRRVIEEGRQFDAAVRLEIFSPRVAAAEFNRR